MRQLLTVKTFKILISIALLQNKCLKKKFIHLFRSKRKKRALRIFLEVRELFKKSKDKKRQRTKSKFALNKMKKSKNQNKRKP